MDLYYSPVYEVQILWKVKGWAMENCHLWKAPSSRLKIIYPCPMFLPVFLSLVQHLSSFRFLFLTSDCLLYMVPDTYTCYLFTRMTALFPTSAYLMSSCVICWTLGKSLSFHLWLWSLLQTQSRCRSFPIKELCWSHLDCIPT